MQAVTGLFCGTARYENDGNTMSGVAQDKDIYLIRHAEGTHNVGYEHHIDAHLTQHGWAQTKQLRDYVASAQPSLPVEAVYVSPLTRTLETAVGVFGAADTDTAGSRVLMCEQGLVPGLRVAAGPFHVPDNLRFSALELCRERVGPHPCDGRRQLTLLAARFPAVDFTLASLDLHRQQQQFRQLRGVLKHWAAEAQLARQLHKKLLVDSSTQAYRPPTGEPVDAPGAGRKPSTREARPTEVAPGAARDTARQLPKVHVHSPYTTPPASTSSDDGAEPLDEAEQNQAASGQGSPVAHTPAAVQSVGIRRLGSDGSLSEWMSGFTAFQNLPQANSPRSREFGVASFKEGEDLVWQALRNQDNSTGRYLEGESEDAVNARAMHLLQFLLTRPERHLALVCHCGILHHMFISWAKQCNLSVEVQAALAEDFENCELRVVRIRDGGQLVAVERLFSPSKVNPVAL